jgi:hypothetical protein
LYLPQFDKPMFAGKKVRLVLATLLVGSLGVGIPKVASGQQLPGFTIIGGPEQKNQLNFFLESGKAEDDSDRYHLRIPADKMKVAAARFVIDYPDYYDGEFNVDRVEVLVGTGDNRKSVEIDEVIWEPENHVIEIYPVEPVPAGKKVELKFSDVDNPDFGGMYYFNARIESPGDVPLLRYVGTWVLTID